MTLNPRSITALSMCFAVMLSPRPAATQVATLVPIVGEWRTAPEDGVTYTVDGAKWNGEASATALAKRGDALFGMAPTSFAASLAAKTGFPLAVAREVPSFSSGTLRVQFKMIGGASDQNAGIVFGLQPTGEYWYVRYNTKDGDLALWRFRNGERELVVHGTGSKQLTLGQWYELVVEVRGNDVSGTIVSVPELALRHTVTALNAGRVGVWVKRDAITSFRDFRHEP